MKKYSFSMTKKEIIEFCIMSVLEQLRLQLAKWLMILGICVLESFMVHWFGILFAVLIIGVTVMAVCRSYSMMKKSLYGKTRTMWVEDGMLKVEAGADAHGEVSCGSIQVIRKTANLLMPGHYQSKKRLTWYPMPLRVFADRREMDEFINLIRNPQAFVRQDAAKAQSTACPSEELLSVEFSSQELPQEAFLPEAGDKELFHLFFRINEERWEQTLLDATQIHQSKLLRGSRGWKIFLAVCGLSLAACACYMLFFGVNIVALAIFFILIFYPLLIIKNITMNPAGRIRKQLNKGLLQNDVYGDWEISVTESGVMWYGPGRGRNMMRFEKFSSLVEAEGAFYLFWDDDRNYIMILKECLGSYEQAQALKQLCMEKNITVTMAKKMKYVPTWVFYILTAVLIAGYMAANIRLAARDSRRNREAVPEIEPGYGAAYSLPEEFDPADYQTYVPLDKQVEILKSLDITVSDKVVEAAQAGMDEYEHMRIYVEGYPYTWLLMEMGAPTYNDAWEITGYSDEVFWFDFEGWDISTDYITILEGMLALAPDSAISSVANIKEDMADADWDKGRGSIGVSLEWNGEEYSWKMDMYYDWIDGKVLGILNSLLEQTDEEERFYAAGDNGQGAIVFYCSKEWAEAFFKATGIELEVE